jgi:hypothetical protein
MLSPDPAVAAPLYLSLDLTARYEHLRAGVLLCGTPDSHEAALIVHRGIPGWVDFAYRFVGDRSPPDPSILEAACPVRTPAVPLTCQRDLVTVLASVILHCLENSP